MTPLTKRVDATGTLKLVGSSQAEAPTISDALTLGIDVDTEPTMTYAAVPHRHRECCQPVQAKARGLLLLVK